MKQLLLLVVILLVGASQLHAGPITLKQPAAAPPVSGPAVRKVLDALIHLAVRMRPQDPPPKVAVAGTKGIVKISKGEVSAFRLGQAMAIIRFAEGTEQYALFLESSILARHELELLLKRAVPAGSSSELQATVDEGLEAALMPHYELGFWMVALRIPLREAVRTERNPLPSELAAYLTGNNLAGIFRGAVRPPVAEVAARLQRLSVYTKRQTISLLDAERALKDLDAIITAYH